MSIADANRWNARYDQDRSLWENRYPKQLVLDFENLLPAGGKVMDAASGVGATGKYLTQKGFLVFCFDISIVGLRIAKQKYAEGDLNFNGVVYDLTRPLFPANYFDAILNFFFLERVTFKEYRKSLKPGGLIFFETFVKDQDDVVAKHYLKKDELLEAFNGFEIIHYDQKTREGRSANSKRKVDQLIARKPI